MLSKYLLNDYVDNITYFLYGTMSNVASPIPFTSRLLTYFLLGIFFVYLLVVEIILYINTQLCIM